MTSVQARYEKPAPPISDGNGTDVRPELAHAIKERAVVTLFLVALGGARRDLFSGEVADGLLKQPFFVSQLRHGQVLG